MGWGGETRGWSGSGDSLSVGVGMGGSGVGLVGRLGRTGSEDVGDEEDICCIVDIASSVSSYQGWTCDVTELNHNTNILLLKSTRPSSPQSITHPAENHLPSKKIKSTHQHNPHQHTPNPSQPRASNHRNQIQIQPSVPMVIQLLYPVHHHQQS